MSKGLILIDADSMVDSICEAAANRLKITANRALGRPFVEIFDPPQDNLFAAVSTVLAGSERELTGTVHSRDLHFEWTAFRVRRSGDRWAVALMITAWSRHESVSDLESYRETFEHAIEGIFRSTLDGQYLEANQALATIYGFKTPAELLAVFRDLNTQLYVNAGRRADFVRLMEAQGYVSDFESEVFRADGATIWITEFARTVFDRGGRPIYFEGSVVDITRRHFDAATLNESEEKFRSLVESLNVVPWEAKLESGELIYVGPQAVGMLGYTDEEFYEPDFWVRHIHPEDREWVAIVKAEAFAKSERFELEYRFMRKDGEVIWLRDLMSVIGANTARPFIGGFLLDVTYHHYTEASLRESQSFFEHLASSTPAIVYLYTLHGEQCLYVNGQALEILGFSKLVLGQMSPFFVLALGHPAELKDHQAHFALLADERKNRAIERDMRLRRADGDWIWLRSRESVFKRSLDGSPLEVVGVATDITLRRLALEELTNDEHLFRSLVETTKVVPFEFNCGSGRLTYVGPQAAVLFGYPTKQWYTEGFAASIIHPDDQKRVSLPFGALGSSKEDDSDIQGEFRLRMANGEYIWVRNIVRFGPEERSQGSGRGFLLDIGEMKHREEELASSRSQLRELLQKSQNVREEERIRIARELHDELGQALTLSRLDLEWIESTILRSAKSNEQEHLMARIGEMKDRTTATIETLRRIYTNLRPPILDVLGLQPAIEWQAREFSRRIGIRCETVLGEMEEPDKDVTTATFRIFQEILTNIAKHAAATSVKVRLEVLEGRLKLAVQDNGRGFSAAPPFRSKGFGILGMNERTEALGGRIDITSSPGEGTLISVDLPLFSRGQGNAGG